jgi:hypothetical protein
MLKYLFGGLVCWVFYQNWAFAQQPRVEKATTHYFTTDSTQITDSILVAFNYYDAQGNLYQREETQYKQGKQSKHFLAYYEPKEKLTAMYEDGKITIKIDYDSLGTIIRDFGIIDNGKDSLTILYEPIYKKGKLNSRKYIFSRKNYKISGIENYTYQEYADSTVVIGIEKSRFNQLINKKCFDKQQRLLYEQHILQSPNKSYNSFEEVRYQLDTSGKVIEISKTHNGQLVSREKIYYSGEKRLKSDKIMPKMRQITIYE